ncbi:uncharacterized protein LOC114265320 [Camellia sinensis]|uniref:uncharacterized protein LOC114265320 n=1 Tax=Camellia sinensis TaxID=4442 RepID=UPI001036CE91|nr:uncharacterized protein LOC114265320 [Camellia sinensis]
MQHFVYVVVFSNPILEIKLVVILLQGLVFCGHDEYENSSNQGNFLELLKFLADHNEDVKVVALSNAPQNLKLTSPDIQKDIVNVAAFETINVIIRDLVSNVVNVVGASCKRRDIVREKQAAKVAKALNTRELSSGQGLNQETNLKRTGDTRWGSHYGPLVSLASMFSTVIDVLEMISEDGSNSEK